MSLKTFFFKTLKTPLNCFQNHVFCMTKLGNGKLKYGTHYFLVLKTKKTIFKFIYQTCPKVFIISIMFMLSLKLPTLVCFNNTVSCRFRLQITNQIVTNY